jgi:hypothetical protein
MHRGGHASNQRSRGVESMGLLKSGRHSKDHFPSANLLCVNTGIDLLLRTHMAL